MHITGTYWTEIALEYEGEAVRYRPATRTDPAEGGNVEDVGVAGLSCEITTRKQTAPGVWKSTKSVVNLLDGCDLKSPDIQRLLMNLTSAFESDLRDAAYVEASEVAA